MLNIFKKDDRGTSVTFKIDGMHCTSCSMNIDGELEDTEGVLNAKTNYATATSVIQYDDKLATKDQLKEIIESLGYLVSEA